MEIIRFGTAGSRYGSLMDGRIVNGLTSKMWVERFQTPGEFVFEGPINARIREQLPLNSLVSHIGTGDVMIVEDHQIEQQNEGDPIVKVTGRSIPAFLENRILWEAYVNFVGVEDLNSVTLYEDEPWDQIFTLLHEHIGVQYDLMTFDRLVWVPYMQTRVGETGMGLETAPERILEPGPILPVILEILKNANLGLKVTRPGSFNPPPYDGDWTPGFEEPVLPGKPKITFEVHSGEDKSAYVVLSHENGDIEDADYLWSSKTQKSVAVVSSKWFRRLVVRSGDASYLLRPGFDRRSLHVDATAFDKDYTTKPEGATKTAILNKMNVLGQEALNAQTTTAITRVKTVERLNKYRYRRDFNIGDYITVKAEYNSSVKTQVMEHVEIDDKEGERGYPTLRIVTE